MNLQYYFSISVLVLLLSCSPSSLVNPEPEPPTSGGGGGGTDPDNYFIVNLTSGARTFKSGVADTLEFYVSCSTPGDKYINAVGYDVVIKDLKGYEVVKSFSDGQRPMEVVDKKVKLVVLPTSSGAKTLTFTFRDGASDDAALRRIEVPIEVNERVYRIRLERAFEGALVYAGMNAIFDLYVVDTDNPEAVRPGEYTIKATVKNTLDPAVGCNLAVGDQMIYCDSLPGAAAPETVIPNQKWDLTINAYNGGNFQIQFTIKDKHGNVSTDYADIEALTPVTSLALINPLPTSIEGSSSFKAEWSYDLHGHFNNVVEMMYTIDRIGYPNHDGISLGKVFLGFNDDPQPDVWYPVGKSLSNPNKFTFEFKPTVTGSQYRVVFQFRDKYTPEVMPPVVHTFTSKDTGFTIVNKTGTIDMTEGISAFNDHNIILELGNYTNQDEFTWYVRRTDVGADHSSSIHLLGGKSWNESTSTGLCLSKTQQITIPFYGSYLSDLTGATGKGSFDVVITDQNGTTKVYAYQCVINRNPLQMGSSQQKFVVTMGSNRATFTIAPKFQNTICANYENMTIKYTTITGTGTLLVGKESLVSGGSVTASGNNHSLEYVPISTGSHSFDVAVTTARGVTITERYTALVHKDLGAFNVTCPEIKNLYYIPYESNYVDFSALLISEIPDAGAFENAKVMWKHNAYSSGGQLSLNGAPMSENSYIAIPNSENQVFRYTATQGGASNIRLTFLLQDGRQKSINYIITIDDGGLQIALEQPYHNRTNHTTPTFTKAMLGFFQIFQKYYTGDFTVTITPVENIQIVGITDLKINQLSPRPNNVQRYSINFDSQKHTGYVAFYIKAVNNVTGETQIFETPKSEVLYNPYGF